MEVKVMDKYIIKATSILIVLVIWGIARKVINKMFKRWIERENQIQVKFTRSIVQALVSVIAVCFIGMQIEFTKDLTVTLLQSTSLIVAVAGFAAQQTLSDIISGLMISWCKPFNIDERVNILSMNLAGVVEDITIRHTIIKTFNNNRVIIPNSIMNKEILENNNFKDSRCGNYLEVTVGYDSDIELAMKIIDETIENHELTIKIEGDSKHDVLIKDFGESGIILKTTVWTKDVSDNFKACSDIRLAIKKRFEENNIEIPYNYVHIKTDKQSNVLRGNVYERHLQRVRTN